MADRACELATNLHKQLMEKGKDFIAYSFAVDESSDTSATAHYRGTFGIKINAWKNHRKRNL